MAEEKSVETTSQPATACANAYITGCVNEVTQKGHIFCRECDEKRGGKIESKKRAEINLLRERNQKLEEEHQQYRESIQKKLISLKNTHAETEMRYETLIRDLSDQNKNHFHEIQKLENMNKELKRENIAYKFTIKKYTADLENVREEMKSAENSVSELERKLIEEKEQREKVEREMKEEREDTEVSVNDVNSQQVELLEKMVHDMKEELDKMKTENARLRYTIATDVTPPVVLPRTPTRRRGGPSVERKEMKERKERKEKTRNAVLQARATRPRPEKKVQRRGERRDGLRAPSTQTMSTSTPKKTSSIGGRRRLNGPTSKS